VRPKLNLRRTRLAYAGAGVTVLAIPAAAAALTASAATSPQATASGGDPLQIDPTPNEIAFGDPVEVSGTAPSADAGHTLALPFAPAGSSSWRTLATTRTGSQGGFELHYVTGAPGHLGLRVRFLGDSENALTSARAGQRTVYRESLASWYDDAGDTACGFHAYFGVANKVLPCGTKVTFRYHGRTVTATVEDRGPYVAGREWDLNQNLAAALGFSGVDTVWVSM